MRVQLGAFTFDRDRRQLLQGSDPVHLSAKAWKLLEILVEKRPNALSKSELYEALWPDTFVQESNLANLVSEVRDALGEDARRPRLLRTVHGFGYALELEAQAPDAPAASLEPQVTFRLLWGSTEIDLDEGENVFGRHRSAGIWLTDESVSRRHARIVVRGGTATLEDLDSKNGTFLRGARVSAPVPLANGDDIAIGSVSMVVRVISTTASTITRDGRS